jgi:hypothetical protein
LTDRIGGDCVRSTESTFACTCVDTAEFWPLASMPVAVSV